VDEPAVVAALDSGSLRAYVSDFPTAATARHPKCVTLPHLGASTVEAEDNCAVMVADQVRDFLERGDVRNSVNFPTVVGAGEFSHRTICAGAGTPTAAAVAAVLDAASISVSASTIASRNNLTYAVLDTPEKLPDVVADQLRRLDGIAMVRVIR